MRGVLTHIDFEFCKVILIASPGFVRDQFFKFMMDEAVKNDIKVILDNKSKFLLVHSSSGFKHSLKGMYLVIYYSGTYHYSIAITISNLCDFRSFSISGCYV